MPDHAHTHIAPRAWQRVCIVVCVIVLCMLGWLKLGITGNIRVDHNPFPVSWGYLVFIVFAASLLLYSLGYWKMVWNTEKDLKFYKQWSYIIVILASCMVPFLSNDVIIYLGHGYLSNHGTDVFGHTDILKNSAWYPYIEDWKDGPFVYGPVNLIPARLANYIGGERLWLTFASYKIMMLGLGFAIIELLAKIVKRPADLLMVTGAPAFWLHNIGHLHNDMIGGFFVIVSVLFLVRNKFLLSLLFFGLAFASKVSVIVYLPFIFLYYIFFRERPVLQKALVLILGAGVMVLAVVLPYTLFWQGKTTVTVPFTYLSNQLPAKSFAEVSGEMLNVIFGSDISNQLEMEEISKTDPKVEWWKKTTKAFHFIGILLGLVTTFVFIVKTNMKISKEILVEYFTKMSFVFFFFYLHIFQAWYLFLLAPFLVLLPGHARIKKYYMVLCCYSGIHTIMIAIDRPSYLFYVLPGLVVINIGLFVWQFRKNYLTVESNLVNK